MSKVAFLFPGQGAQTVGMGQSLVELPAAARMFAQANEVLGYDLLKVCLEGPAEKLNATDVSQPALYVMSLAAVEQLKQQEPEVVASAAGAAGLSLGEYTALAFADAMSFEDGLRIVQARGKAMQRAADLAPSGMMSILGLDVDKGQAICDELASVGRLRIANFLCPGNYVVSGDAAAIDRVEELATAAGAMKTIRLSVAGAFHSPIMQPAVDDLAKVLDNVTIKSPRIPVYSNVDAKTHTDPDEIRALLRRQVLESVLWEESMKNMLADGFDKFYELGPGRVLAGLMKRIARRTEVVNVTV